MTNTKLNKFTVQQLVDLFAEIGAAQDDAIENSNSTKFNRLYDDMVAIELELKAREGDQRRALIALYSHPNVQVRLNVATATLAINPSSARQALKAIADSRLYPQAGDAGMLIRGLDDGSFKPG